MSHTVRMDIKLKNREILATAAAACGATVLGEGSHRLYGGQQTGFGIKLPGWQYPVIFDKEGIASFDNYGGRWGDQRQLTQFQEAYAFAAAKKVCQDQGWYCEQRDGILTIHHPTGGVITVEGSGLIDASGFTGPGCAQATEEIEKALGVEVGRTQKAEYNETAIEQTQVED